ncbi:MAG: hypothetical protein NZX77_02315 [Polyangiaceae bacterium]|nr:hypothetical protein [Polyangiaceae bacterium]
MLRARTFPLIFVLGLWPVWVATGCGEDTPASLVPSPQPSASTVGVCGPGTIVMFGVCLTAVLGGKGGT